MNTDNVTLLDGAMGTELRARGVHVRDYKKSLWSALACEEHHDAVIQLHLDYIDAGSDIITANNYAITPALLAREDREKDLSGLLSLAGQCARDAAQSSKRDILVAGSLPPLNTSYDAAAVAPFEQSTSQYTRIANSLNPYVDFYICETMSTTQEALSAATVANASAKPFMLSWTVDRTGHALRSNEPLETAIRALDDLSPAALLVNCTSCEAASRSIKVLRENTDLPVGAYANPVHSEPQGGEPERVPKNKLSPEEYARQALGWIADGASIVGGCCDTSPSYIAAICHHLPNSSCQARRII